MTFFATPRWLMALLFVLPVSPCLAADGVPDGFTLALGGDTLGPYHSLPGPEDTGFNRVADLFRHADMGFANQEGSVLDMTAFSGWPALETGGGYSHQDLVVAHGWREMGLTMVSKANNHATDYGTEGLVSTLANLKAAGIAQAGAGMSDAQARAPGYVETPKGLAALVDTASTFTPMSQAGPAVTRLGVTTRPRPGISVLHVREVRLVPAAEVEQLRQQVEDGYSPPGEARIGDMVFRASDTDGWLWEMSAEDEAAILESVRQARAKARFVLFSIHAHETARHDDTKTPPATYDAMAVHRAIEAPSGAEPRPAEFEPVLFHAAIDAGADAVLRTGPHVLEGIEIYKGRPIFYGIGSLFSDHTGRRGHEIPGGFIPFPPGGTESVVPVITYKSGKASMIRLTPIVMLDGDPATTGVPRPADPERGLKILKRLQTLSAAFGTTIAIEHGVGVIRIP